MGMFELITFVYAFLMQRRAIEGQRTAARWITDSTGFIVEYVALHVRFFHLLSVLFLHCLNVFLYLYKFPVFGALLLGSEVLVLLYLLYMSPMQAAIRGLISSVISLFSFGFMAVHANASDSRIAELQAMVNTLMEENHRLMDEMAEMRLDLLKSRQSESAILKMLSSHLGGTSIGYEVAVLVLLVLVLLLGVTRTVYCCVVSKRRRRDAIEYIELESYIPGSRLVTVAAPPGVAKVLDGEDDRYLGSAALVNLPESPNSIFVITAGHVLAGIDKAKLQLSSGQIFGLPSSSTRIDLGDDIVAHEVVKDKFLETARHADAQFRVSDLLKLVKNAAKNMAVNVYGNGKSSTGVVGPLTNKFGVVTYSGTTEKGFSGTPYLVGNIVYGIHTSGTSAYNMGVDAACIRAHLLRWLTEKRQTQGRDVVLEDSNTVEWLVQEFQDKRKKSKAVWRHYGDDLYDVRVNGKYYTVERDDMIRMGFIEGEVTQTISYDDIDLEGASDSEPAYDDSENSKRGSALARAPGAANASRSAPRKPSTSSSVESTSQTAPPELTSQTMSHLLSIHARLDDLSRRILDDRRPVEGMPLQAPAATTSRRKKAAAPAPPTTPAKSASPPKTN